MERYYSFRQFLRERFPQPVYKVCIDAGFRCPNLDGTLSEEGCTYCNNASFSPLLPGDPSLSIPQQIERGIQRQRRARGDCLFLAYFQSYTNTHAPVDVLQQRYQEALCCEGVVGLNISTRPDCLGPEILELLSHLAEKHFILLEVGLQSTHDRTLQSINRGHNYGCFLELMKQVRVRSFGLGVHLILGLPGEDEGRMLETATRMSQFSLDCMKIHNLQIVRGTKMANLYQQRSFPLYSREEYIDLLCKFLELLSPKIAIERMFATTVPHLLVAPEWARDNSGLLQDIQKELQRRNTWQGRLFKKGGEEI